MCNVSAVVLPVESRFSLSLPLSAFLLQVQNILQSGTMTKENTEYLGGMRDKMGLSKEQAEKIIKGVQNQRMLTGVEAKKATGQLTLKTVLDMKESGVDVDSFVSEELRLSLYAKEVISGPCSMCYAAFVAHWLCFV